jgi:hypothetical protein
MLFATRLLRDDESTPDQEDLLDAAGMASDITRTNPSVGTALAVLTAAVAGEHGYVLDGVLSSLDAAAALADPRGAWWLREFSLLPTHPAYRSRAQALWQQFAAQGRSADYTVDAVFVRGFLTQVDGSGARSLYLVFRRGEETDALTFLLHDRVGVKDCNLLPSAAAEVEALLQAEGRLRLVPCTVELARELLGDALARQSPTRKVCSGSFLLCRAYLGAEPIAPRRREPDTSAFPTPSTASARKLLSESHQLAASDVFGGFTFCSNAAYAFVAALPNWEDDMAPLDEHLDAFIDEVALPERPLLLERMAANVELEVLAGHARKKIPRMAAVVWRALSEDPAAFAEATYVRALADQSMWNVSENMRLGFTSQAEADQAALDMERQSFAESMDGDLWEFDDEEDGL